jgi:WD40 repeat protein
MVVADFRRSTALFAEKHRLRRGFLAGRIHPRGRLRRRIILWKYAEGKLITLRGHTKEVDSIAFSPDGLLLASGSWDATVRFWRVSDGEQLRTLENVTGWVTDLSFASDGVLLASGSGDGTIYLWGIAP